MLRGTSGTASPSWGTWRLELTMLAPAPQALGALPPGTQLRPAGSVCLLPAGHGRGAGQRPGGGTGLRAEGSLFQHARWLWGFEVCPALLM